MRAQAFFVAAAITAFAGSAAAQADPEPGAEAPSAGGWTLHPHEKHILVRAEFSTGFQLQDPFAQGRLAPPSLLVEASFAFLRVGPVLLGPSLGVQAGFDGTYAQLAVQPGIMGHWRLSPRWALNARVDVPLLITRGACEPFATLSAGPGFQGSGILANRGQVIAPGPGYCPALAVGTEVAVGGAFYVRSGFAITAEAIFDLYFGDGGFIYPSIGGGIGVLLDSEILP